MNHPDEPTNEDRADRIPPALEAYIATRGDTLEGGPGSLPGLYDLADILADMRHYCDRERIDFNHAVAVSQDHHDQEVTR